MRKRILFVDDDPGIRFAAPFILMGTGCKVSVASNGREALSLLLEAEKKQRPFDLLLTDMEMPCLTGAELIEELKKRGLSLPVIVLTGGTDQAMIDRIRAHDPIEIRFKPYDFQELCQLVVSTLRKNRSHLSLTGS